MSLFAETCSQLFDRVMVEVEARDGGAGLDERACRGASMPSLAPVTNAVCPVKS